MSSIRLRLYVVQVGEEPVEGLPMTYDVSVTLSHTFGHVRDLIWWFTKKKYVRPEYLTIEYKDEVVGDTETVGNILKLTEILDNKADLGLKLVVHSHPLVHVPPRDPIRDFFDIKIHWMDNQGISRHILERQNLDCTIGSLKDVVIEELRKNGMLINRDTMSLKLGITEKILEDEEKSLSNVLNLDVPPLQEVSFTLENKDISHKPCRRFHVKVEPLDDTSLDWDSLFEVNCNTTLGEFKEEIINRMNRMSVKRIFSDQVRLYYALQLISNVPADEEKKLYDILLLNEKVLNEDNGTIVIQLETIDYVNGTNGGLFSSDFWNDLRSPQKFDFLPNPRSGHNLNTSDSANSAASHPFVPTKIVTDGGKEWTLTGDTYNSIVLNKSERPDGKEEKLLVNQSRLSTVDYDFSFKLDNKGETFHVVLDTSQCIIVDPGTHQPYVLLNQSGASKLNSVLQNGSSSLMQQVKVLSQPESSFSPYNDTARDSRNNTNDLLNRNQLQGEMPRAFRSIGSFFSNNLGRIGTALKYFLFFYFIGFHRLILYHKWLFAKYFIICAAIYAFIIRPSVVEARLEQYALQVRGRRAERLTIFVFLRGIARVFHISHFTFHRAPQICLDSLVSLAVQRKRSYEYLAMQESNTDTRWFYFTEEFSTLWRTTLLMLLSFWPPMRRKAQDRLQEWYRNEGNELLQLVSLLHKKLIHSITLSGAGDINSVSAEKLIEAKTGQLYDSLVDTIDRPLDSNLASETNQKLLKYYIEMKKLDKDLKKRIRISQVESITS